eukprot:5340498-Amphidinium_carterae.1
MAMLLSYSLEGSALDAHNHRFALVALLLFEWLLVAAALSDNSVPALQHLGITRVRIWAVSSGVENVARALCC